MDALESIRGERRAREAVGRADGGDGRPAEVGNGGVALESAGARKEKGEVFQDVQGWCGVEELSGCPFIASGRRQCRAKRQWRRVRRSTRAGTRRQWRWVLSARDLQSLGEGELVWPALVERRDRSGVASCRGIG